MGRFVCAPNIMPLGCVLRVSFLWDGRGARLKGLAVIPPIIGGAR
jgi:hypothetical protein